MKERTINCFFRIQKRREGTNDRDTLLALSRQEKEHLQLIKAERVWYAKRMVEAKNEAQRDPSNASVLSVAMDGADQGAYGLPFYSQVL